MTATRSITITAPARLRDALVDAALAATASAQLKDFDDFNGVLFLPFEVFPDEPVLGEYANIVRAEAVQRLRDRWPDEQLPYAEDRDIWLAVYDSGHPMWDMVNEGTFLKPRPPAFDPPPSEPPRRPDGSIDTDGMPWMQSTGGPLVVWMVDENGVGYWAHIEAPAAEAPTEERLERYVVTDAQRTRDGTEIVVTIMPPAKIGADNQFSHAVRVTVPLDTGALPGRRAGDIVYLTADGSRE